MIRRSAPSKVKVQDNNGGMQVFDAFSRAEVAVPFTLADYTFPYDLNPLLFDDLSSGGSVTHLPNESSFELNSGTTLGNTAVFQSRRYHRYQAGKAGKIVLTGVPGAAQPGVTKRWGYFDPYNGLFFQLDGDGTFSVVIRSSTTGTPVDTKITQGNFNSDKVDGTGSSGFDIDFTKANIYELDFQWLGVGVVSFRVAFHDGGVIYLHTINNPNNKSEVYMTTATLPIRYEVENTGTLTSAGTFKGICSSVVSSGGEEPPESEFTAGNDIPVTTTDATEVPIVAIRLKKTFNSLDNRMLILPKDVEFSSDKGSALFKLYLNPTLTGGTWTSIDDESGVEYNVGMSISSVGMAVRRKAVLASSGNPQQSSRSITTSVGVRKLALSRSADNSSSDILLITVKRLTTTNIDAAASIAWGEVR